MYALGRVSTKVVEKILKFEILNILMLLFFLGWGWKRLTRQSIGNYKMCYSLKMTGRRAKRTNIWDSGVST